MYIKKSIFILIFLHTAALLPQSRFEFNLDTSFGYSTFYESPYISDGKLYAPLNISAGMIGSYVFDVFQLSYAITPGVKIFEDISTSSQNKISLMFDSIFIRIDGLSYSLAVGKRQLAWGTGNLRQYSFFTNVGHAEEISSYYNAEISIRKEALLFSIGSAFDTISIDQFQNPKWITPWLYMRYDNPKYTILGSLNMFYYNNTIGNKKNYDIKGAVEFQYFLPVGFQIYSTLAYYFLKENRIGLEKDIRFLSGVSWEYFYESIFIFFPSIEYIRELDYNILSAGFRMGLKEIMFDIFANYQFNSSISNPSLLARVVLNLPSGLTLHASSQSFFWDTDNIIKNIFLIKIQWSI